MRRNDEQHGPEGGAHHLAVVRGAAGAMVAVLVGALLTSCGSSGPSADSVAQQYLTAWSKQDYHAMAALVEQPPKTFVSFNQQVASALDLQKGTYHLGTVTTNGGQANAAVTQHLTLAPFGPLTVRSRLSLVSTGGTWRVQWSPGAVLPQLGPGDSVSTTVSWPARAAILGADNAPLTTEAPMVQVGIVGSRVTDPTALTAALQQTGATAAQISSALSTAQAHPTWFTPVIEIPQATYEQLKPTIYNVPGTQFQTTSQRTAVTPGLAAHVVGATGPITAQELHSLGSPYQAGDIVGQSGLEQADERQLAGKPGGKIEVLSSGGSPVATVATFATQPGTPVTTTIDPTTQQAAEAALTGVAQPAAMVAIQASTGDVVASVSDPGSTQFDNALDGAFPPGSTFKVVTSADLIEHGLTPSSPASCPATITVDGKTFHNFEGEAAASLSLEQAFAESCNAAFIGLSAQLPDASFPTTASQFGIGATYQLGLATFGGKVPVPGSDVERAATSIGQANVLVSPLSMAVAAAAVDSGTLHLPQLVTGGTGSGSTSTAGQALDPTVLADLRTMMTAVVDDPIGTASGAGLPAGTLGKTGTAEFGTANPPQTHAWFMGYRGDIAFAVLVVGGGIGGTVAAPLAAKFLDALGPTS